MDDKVLVHIQVTREMHEAILRQAKAEDVNKSQFVRKAIRYYFKNALKAGIHDRT